MSCPALETGSNADGVEVERPECGRGAEGKRDRDTVAWPLGLGAGNRFILGNDMADGLTSAAELAGRIHEYDG